MKKKINANNMWMKLVVFTLLVSTILTLVSDQNVSDSTNNWSGPQSSSGDDPILINGTAELDAFCEAGQDGTFSNPYIIENYVIDATTAEGIYIINTNSYLIIRNNTVENGTAGNNEGILLEKCSNVLITENTLYGNEDGILLYPFSYNNTIFNNTVINNDYGIHLAVSDNNTVQGNHIIENGYGIHLSVSDSNAIQENYLLENGYGIHLSSSDICLILNNTLQDNTDHGISLSNSDSNIIFANIMENDGIFVQDTCFQNSIAANNTVNGKSVLYYENQTGITLTSEDNAGQVILVNCDYATIEGQEITNVGSGIQVIGSNHGLIFNNTVENSNVDGIYIYESNNITVSENTVSNSVFRGIFVRRYSSNCTITGNSVMDNEFGIDVSWETHNSVISNNTVIGNNYGISVAYCYNATLMGNFVEGNLNVGIDISTNSLEHKVTENILSANHIGLGVHSYNCSTTIWKNYFIENTLYQAHFFDGGDNSWDKDSIGNYWSDYTARYPNAAVIDQVWDTPYELMWGDYDNFPLYIDLTPPTWENPVQDQICYDDESFFYDVNATDEAAIAEYWLNDTSTFQIDAEGLIMNITSLSLGIYYLEIFVNDTSGNLLTEAFQVNVVKRTNAVWTPVSDTIYLECYDAELRVWMSVIVTTTAETEIKLTFQSENPTAVDLEDNMQNIGYYIIEFQDPQVIELLEVNFYFSDDFSEEQKENLKLYSLGAEWGVLQADVNVLENKITVFLSQEELKTINRYTIGFVKIDPGFSIPSYPMNFLALFLIITMIAIGFLTKRKTK
ncbi:MAG: NosD domain-containing protein [Promethearchaeota archaeon]